MSSDSSQSDREQQLNNTSNLNLNQHITSPVSTSSPSNQYNTNNRVSMIQTPNNTSNHFNSTSSPNNATLTNDSIPIQKSINIINNTNGNNKPYKPFNSQTGQFYQREMNGTVQKSTNLPTNNNNGNSRSSTLSLNSNLSIPQQNIYTTKLSSNSSPNNMSKFYFCFIELKLLSNRNCLRINSEYRSECFDH